jgi:hypothetical protein
LLTIFDQCLTSLEVSSDQCVTNIDYFLALLQILCPGLGLWQGVARESPALVFPGMEVICIRFVVFQLTPWLVMLVISQLILHCCMTGGCKTRLEI